MINTKNIGLASLFKTPGVREKYRAWALAPETAQFLSLAADLVSPKPSDPTTRSVHSEAVAMLVRRETAEEFMEACQRLEDFADLEGDNVLPPTTYGATLPTKKTEAETAMPPKA
jgi:hypothetical protein